MNRIALIAFAIVTLAIPCVAAPVKLTGTMKYPDGSVFNGSIELRMARSGVVNTCSTPSIAVPTTTAVANVVNGTVNGSSLAIVPTDCLSPREPYYVRVMDSRRTILFADNWYVAPTDIAATEMNVGFLSSSMLLLGAQSPVQVSIPRAVLISPTATQTIVQPGGTSFIVTGDTQVTSTTGTVTVTLNNSAGLAGTLAANNTEFDVCSKTGPCNAGMAVLANGFGINIFGSHAGSPGPPAAGVFTFFVDTADGNKLKVVGHSGTVTTIAVP